MPSALRTFTLNFVGDVMLGRLVDQLWPQHVDNAHEHRVVSWFLERYPHLAKYSHRDPWGSALPLFHTADLNLINLETSATTTNDPWPNKTFNYRMHPANLAALREAHIDYAGLANNHTLDFGTDGLVETIWSVKENHIAFAGAGESTDESRRPAVLHLPRPAPYPAPTVPHHQHHHQTTRTSTSTPSYKIHIYAASDHPRDWAVVPTFHLIDYSPRTKDHLRTLLTQPQPASDPPALKIFSIHWGPNYRWQPDERIRALAHFLIDECGVDIVHGHSSHHVQGVERYARKLIIYGCGDFVDDYALREEFRNDLGAVWRVCVREEVEVEADSGVVGEEEGVKPGLVLDRLEIFPTRCDRFQATLLDPDDEDHRWVKRKITQLSEDLGTSVRRELGTENQIVVDLRD
ncbi:CapA family protein [Aspergillus clavatus NRRL 1]|uniref:Polyglutamate biosynthesis protein, putative n=1 Tax=Aspergillus clavatus (strain ATCC 1007 / CBS 513.65 / DSM 816 / NCTC 3887 / NRRL 1 / QM 1276 / 107) TaxID=344612 RepID=A1CB76_ASPCL|nr:polyglutamate biosynthesis protein, putative [Aspergillus clavatus NRRL 1]EAW12994.1 polyglutamate biosynthesis protein, putative [Aspergillus clavatus NRRL 1]